MSQNLKPDSPKAQAPECPLCAKTEYKIQWRDGNRTFGCCTHCGLAYVQPFQELSTGHLGSVSSSVTKSGYLRMMKQNAMEREVTSGPVAQRRINFYTRVLKRKPSSILEIGAGDGAFSESYRQLGVNYVGFDIDPTVVDTARSLGRNVELGGVADALNLGKSFDIVFASQVLEHILTPVPFLAEIRQLLSGDGLVHLDVPNHDGLSALVRRARPTEGEYGFLQPPHHQIAYTAATLENLLKHTGFDPILIASKGNLDPMWGQLSVTRRPFKRSAMVVAGKLGMGSLLIAVACPSDKR